MEINRISTTSNEQMPVIFAATYKAVHQSLWSPQHNSHGRPWRLQKMKILSCLSA